MVPTEVLLNQLTVYAMPDRIDAYRQTMEGMAGAADSKTVRVYHRLESHGRTNLGYRWPQ